MQEPTTDERGLGDGIVFDTILDGLTQAVTDWWWLWLLMAGVLVAAKILTDWSRRVEARAKTQRRTGRDAKRQR